ncbi:MAG: nicotinate-nucleotide--dimethylbenzimidazole phosphoribosyltransferase [Crocinitomicaceae bacterium]|nr:nicotinate-nucleotide--dimethylbenzimidazole phosphoribosyltransferase [Crocinitomicaceae bacterium]
MLEKELISKINGKTKPLGALGKLEELAFQVGKIQQTLSPKITEPTIVVFAGDHGIAKLGVSEYPQEVTHQMVLNFCNGGAAINVFCRQHNIHFKIVDAGVNFTFDRQLPIVHHKINFGTKNILIEPAMTRSELALALKKGEEVVDKVVHPDCNCIGFGEMGIGNTSSSALIMSGICNLPLDECVGLGTSLNEFHTLKKTEVLALAQQQHGTISDPLLLLQTYGGFEMAQMCGAMLAAYRKNSLIIVEGFIATAVFLVAQKMESNLINNSVFAHISDEKGHALMLEYLGVTPLLNLDMCLGEGTACAIAFPLIQSAVNFLNEMASFEEANVLKK